MKKNFLQPWQSLVSHNDPQVLGHNPSTMDVVRVNFLQRSGVRLSRASCFSGHARSFLIAARLLGDLAFFDIFGGRACAVNVNGSDEVIDSIARHTGGLASVGEYGFAIASVCWWGSLPKKWP